MKKLAFVLIAILMWTGTSRVHAQKLQGKDLGDWRKLVNDLDPATRKSAFEAMCAFAKNGSPTEAEKSISILIDAVSNPKKKYRSLAITTLGEVTWEPQQRELLKRSLEALQDVIVGYFLAKENLDIAVGAAQSIGAIGEKSADPDIRARAITTLKEASNLFIHRAGIRQSLAAFSFLKEYVGVLNYVELKIEIIDPVLEAVERSLTRVVVTKSNSNALGLESAIRKMGGQVLLTYQRKDRKKRDKRQVREEIRIDVILAGTSILNDEFAVVAKSLFVPLLENAPVLLAKDGTKAKINMKLDLSRTRLGDAALDSLSEQFRKLNVKLRNVKPSLSLDLSETAVTNQGLGRLKNLCNLTELDLSNTKIDDCGLSQLQGLKTLKKLVLARTPISDLGLQYLGDLDRLETLGLSNTKVGDAGLAYLCRLKLKKLDLTVTKITDAGMAWLDLSRMNSLQLATTSIGDPTLVRLNALAGKCLKVLDISATRVTDTGLGNLGGLNSLQELDLSYTYVGDPGLAIICNVTDSKLQKLDLSNTRVGDCSLQELTNLKCLRKLVLEDTFLTDEGLDCLAVVASELSMNRKDPVNVKKPGFRRELRINNNREISYSHIEKLRAAFRKCCAQPATIYSSFD